MTTPGSLEEKMPLRGKRRGGGAKTRAKALRAGFALALALMAASPAAATIVLPKKAKTLKGELVTGYQPCTVTNASMTAPFSSAACGAPGPLPLTSNPFCAFGPKGSGKWSLTVNRTDIKGHARLIGLDPICEGRELELRLGLRITTDDSASGEVTTVDRSEIAVGSCTVASGRCDISSTFETFFGAPTVFKDGQVYSIEILQVEVWDHDGAISLRTFANGLRVGPN